MRGLTFFILTLGFTAQAQAEFAMHLNYGEYGGTGADLYTEISDNFDGVSGGEPFNPAGIDFLWHTEGGMGFGFRIQYGTDTIEWEGDQSGIDYDGEIAFTYSRISFLLGYRPINGNFFLGALSGVGIFGWMLGTYDTAYDASLLSGDDDSITGSHDLGGTIAIETGYKFGGTFSIGIEYGYAMWSYSQIEIGGEDVAIPDGDDEVEADKLDLSGTYWLARLGVHF